jgi:hypothetical protein
MLTVTGNTRAFICQTECCISHDSNARAEFQYKGIVVLIVGSLIMKPS